jgi:hypothetical protein
LAIKNLEMQVTDMHLRQPPPGLVTSLSRQHNELHPRSPPQPAYRNHNNSSFLDRGEHGQQEGVSPNIIVMAPQYTAQESFEEIQYDVPAMLRDASVA